MRTTLKRGVGRGAGASGNGKAVFPPGPPPQTVTAVTRYRQPPPPAATGLGLFRRILLITLLGVTSLILGAAGGGYLYSHQIVAGLRAHTPAVVKASKALDVPVANRAAIALVIGYDHRSGVEANRPSLSDTLMLIRADPVTKSISLLSFPRDLSVPIYCNSTTSAGMDRINSAYSRCGPKGTLLTVKKLTGLPVNYLITVNFHGFKQVVDTLGGIWMDIDRRYYNKNTGSYLDNFANINLQPGYQKLSGQQALDFVRFRHTDSDLTRVARQQQFVRAFKEQVSHSITYTRIPHLVSTITKNIEVGEGGHALQLDQVISYALFAQSLPGGHFFQDKINNVDCASGPCLASTSDIQQAVSQFQSPDVQAPTDANAAALGQKVKQTAPAPSSVTVTVLNGNGVSGAAANTSYLLAQRGYQTLTPPNNLEPNYPRQFHSKIYYDPLQKRSKAAAVALQNLMQPADIQKLPRTPRMLALDPGSMLMVVLGSAFDGSISPLPTRTVPTHQQPTVRYDASAKDLLQPYVKKVPFKLMVPTVLDSGSVPDTLPGDKPIAYYWMDPKTRKNKGIRLVFHTGGNEFWGIQETDFTGAPALGDRSFHRILKGRAFDLYYTGAHLHMVVLRQGGSTYWVVNTLLDSLSNETMLAIAKGLKPLTSIH
ncbi:MAG: polyisoprenyl-teichoic acid--peptidoglycan teichoic acid transferase [Gaiellaceae bacterium]|jgi:LCP family protein required for cell wall assembly|nr:polyisoprenyl-teichoic acid--peptidoglycan teichoic acid transferase [Gaiellaceae bacterium]